jgi:DNA-directed RNA polymerase specialized sigma24 family protein
LALGRSAIERPPAIPGQDSKAEMEVALVNRAVSDAARGLPEQQRQVAELAYSPGSGYREVACALQIPEGTVMSRLRLTLSKLEALLDGQLWETT